MIQSYAVISSESDVLLCQKPCSYIVASSLGQSQRSTIKGCHAKFGNKHLLCSDWPVGHSAVMRTQCALDSAKRIQSLYTSSLQRTHLFKT